MIILLNSIFLGLLFRAYVLWTFEIFPWIVKRVN